jgi:hypothetical protein
MNQALKGRHRFLADYAKACVALSGLKLNSILKPRVPEPAVRAPLPWALLHRAFSALGIRLSLTRMPSGAQFPNTKNTNLISAPGISWLLFNSNNPHLYPIQPFWMALKRQAIDQSCRSEST